MKVLITGASGLIGSALSAHLSSAGHTVLHAVRGDNATSTATAVNTSSAIAVNTSSAIAVKWNPRAGTIDADKLVGIDAVVHLAGAGIGDKRWTDDYKREILESRTKGTSLIASTISQLPTKPTVFLSGSAIGIYGATGDEELTETSPHGSGFLADVCEQWEAAAAPAVQAGIRTVYLRTGIVLSTKGGALKKQLPIFKAGLGGKFKNGKHWQSWISIDDEVTAITHLLSSQLSGPVNLTAPHPVTNGQFTKELGRALRRPAFQTIPSFGPKLLLGGELAEALLFTGQRVLPNALSKDGFTFAHPTLDVALRALLARS